VEVTGDAIGTGTGNSFGAYANNGGEVTVGGNATGHAYGARADGTNSKVEVTGDVTATGVSSIGAYARNGGEVTIDGVINASNVYIQVAGINKVIGDGVPSILKPGYLEYTSGLSFVWVKI
jgi:hypothetical protein